jgi:[acyl-carrier-protein] S-malonyltransferase
MGLAFVFPGQGSQSVGMLDGFLANDREGAVAGLVARANAVLQEDLGSLIAQGPAETLNLTTHTQPAMLLAGFAALTAWRTAGGPEPIAVAGHSLGEYTALAAAQSLRFEDAVGLVRVRAQAMQAAVPVGTGAMAAILGLDDPAVQATCEEASAQARSAGEPAVVEAVNFNAPAQVVIAGDRQAVERACALAKAAGAKRALLLPVSAPFHSSLLRPAGDVLARALVDIDVRTPAVDLINNVDVAIEREPERIRDALVRQAWGPVRWVQIIQRLEAMGITHVVEMGPGKVLTGLAKRIAPTLKTSAVADPESLAAALAECGA